MTLHEWCLENNVTAWWHFGRQCYYIPDMKQSEQRGKLWNLEDYRVTEVCGGTIWLGMKEEYTEKLIGMAEI
jgi:hypothetical protein